MLNKLKKMVKKKARPEGSICEAYLVLETTHFCSYYFEPHVQCSTSRVGRNEDDVEDDTIQPILSIFNLPGHLSGSHKRRYLNDKEYDAARLCILLNCFEVRSYIE